MRRQNAKADGWEHSPENQFVESVCKKRGVASDLEHTQREREGAPQLRLSREKMTEREDCSISGQEIGANG